MVNIALDSLNEVDLVLFLVEATCPQPGPGDLYIIEQLKNLKTPVFCLINKIDLVEKEQILPIIAAYKDTMEFSQIIPISALEYESVEVVKNEIKKFCRRGLNIFPTI